MFFFSNFSDVDGVIKRANATEYGLASGVFTKDINKAMHVADGIKAGTVFVNTYNKTDVASPFGGFKQSGFGKDLGKFVEVDHFKSFLSAGQTLIKMSQYSYTPSDFVGKAHTFVQ